MKTTNPKLTIILVIFSFCHSNAQIFNNGADNLYDIKNDIEAELDSIHQAVGDSVFYHEGSYYNEYKKWLYKWEPRLWPSGDFSDYYQKQQQSIISMQTNFPYFRSSSVTTNQTAWREVGPFRKPDFGTQDGSNGGQESGTGPIRFITFYKGNPQEMLCGSEPGCFFRQFVNIV